VLCIQPALVNRDKLVSIPALAILLAALWGNYVQEILEKKPHLSAVLGLQNNIF
jgi:hypothetical protein